jgi:alkylation response protein AidB-like acyl-CoA dehydrogenase
VPRAYGGADVPATVLAEVTRVIAAVDPAIAQVPQSHFLFVDVLAVLGTRSQRHRLFGDVLAGARLGNGLAERGGQHAQDLRTRLSGRGTGMRLSGHKYYCTGALTARWIGVSALDDTDRLVLAFVGRDSPGVRLYEDWNVMGQRATVSGGALFDDVAVDPRLVIPYQQAFEAPQQFGARTQLVHAAIEVGIAGGALRDAGEFVRTLARPFFEVTSDLFSLSGASAADERHDLSRHWRNARTHGSHDPVAWKYHHVGNYLLNGALPPNHGQI